jgi:pyruvate dehydrogenase E2 component (dihydrolipoamide acetyltransferase)
VTTQTVVVVMPRLSDSMEEGTVVRWLKDDGDAVTAGDDLVEVETDKATMAYQAEAAGVLRRIVEEGATVALGAPIAELLPPGADLDAPAAPSDAPVAPVAASRQTDSGSAEDASAAHAELERRVPGNGRPSRAGRVAASPVARRLAAHGGLDLAALAPGSGPRGRIVKRDVERAIPPKGERDAQPALDAEPAPGPAAAPAPRTDAAPAAAEAARPADSAKGAVTVAELTRVQATVARRMAESHATVPDFSLEVDVDAGALVALRTQLGEALGDTPVPTFNDFIVKACARALRMHPRVNGAYRDGHVERYQRVNIGVAVAADAALLVPVLADADVRSIGWIAAESRRLAERARQGALTPPELSGGTFTVSNLGMYGISRFTAVVNPPQAAILAVGALEQRPVVRDGQVVAGSVLTLTLCSDHRILYGADAAAFLADIREGLDEPMRLLV